MTGIDRLAVNPNTNQASTGRFSRHPRPLRAAWTTSNTSAANTGHRGADTRSGGCHSWIRSSASLPWKNSSRIDHTPRPCAVNCVRTPAATPCLIRLRSLVRIHSSPMATKMRMNDPWRLAHSQPRRGRHQRSPFARRERIVRASMRYEKITGLGLRNGNVISAVSAMVIAIAGPTGMCLRAITNSTTKVAPPTSGGTNSPLSRPQVSNAHEYPRSASQDWVRQGSPRAVKLKGSLVRTVPPSTWTRPATMCQRYELSACGRRVRIRSTTGPNKAASDQIDQVRRTVTSAQLAKAREMLIPAGPSNTTKRAGKMQNTSGKTIFTGAAKAFSWAR